MGLKYVCKYVPNISIVGKGSILLGIKYICKYMPNISIVGNGSVTITESEPFLIENVICCYKIYFKI